MRRQWFRHAALRLRSGDLPGYYEVCDRMNANLSGTVHIDSAIDLVRTCVLDKRPFGDALHWVTVADKLVDSRSNESFLYVLGCACFPGRTIRPGRQVLSRVTRSEPRLGIACHQLPRFLPWPVCLGQPDDALQALTDAALAT